MASDDQPTQAGGLYERRIGTPTTTDEVNGYWLFGFGVLLGLAGVVLFLFTERATTARGIGYALAALAPVFVMLGAVIRLPLRRPGTYLGYLGTTVSVLGVVWFVSIFPDGWFTASGDATVITLYGVGLLLIGLAGTVVPLLSDPVYEDYERMRGEAAAATATAEEASEEAAATREELDATRDELTATESELDAAREDLASTESELEAAREDLTAAEAAAASLRESKARFELFEDAGGSPAGGSVTATATPPRPPNRGTAAAGRPSRGSTACGGTRSARRPRRSTRASEGTTGRRFSIRSPPAASAAGRARRPRT